MHLATRCPYCGTEVRGVTDLDGTGPGPVPGLIILCYQCAEPSAFRPDRTLRRLTPPEQAFADQNQQIQEMRWALIRARAKVESGDLTDRMLP
jgi:hypothetical protein